MRRQKNIVPTLVYQLARHSQLYAKSLLAADKLDSVNKQLAKQMQDLLVGPWEKCNSDRSIDLPPYLVIIDALDEIDGKGGSGFLQELLMTIEKGHLRGLKFLITSRPDPHLAVLCKSFKSDAVCYLQDVTEEEADKDITTYLHAALPEFQHEPELAKLVSKAGGLFIYASTAVRYILSNPESSKGERRDLMGKLLDSDDVKKSLDFSEATVQIDSLYSQILSEAFSGFSREHIQARLQILHTILCAEERISTSIAAALLPNSQNVEDMQERAHSLVQKLHAVLYMKDKCVFWYHASFPDFIFTQARSSNVALMATGNFRSKDIDMSCDIAYYHSVLTQKCFDIMMKDLKFDMCKFPSSFLKDSEVADLGVMEKVSGVLRNSCNHWAQHMMKATPKNHKGICKQIAEFLNIGVLFWIETMNLLQVSSQCTGILQKARHCMTKVR
ncbi:hypothetical protein C0991_005699 [Blastosporella zonata]|nr:hypothetical protein C0991_006644 [Blastosporella zonata]KAG6863453.1 hypothetical protein C0991_005699 [Blastosporella zonata]